MAIQLNRNRGFGPAIAWVAAVTGLILLVPLVAMQFTHQVDWGMGDFLLMGLLVFSLGSTVVWVFTSAPAKWRLLMAAGLILTGLYVWAELAVGVFFDLGS